MIRVWHAVAALGALAVGSELVWQLQYGVASPLRALVFVALAVCVGDLYRRHTIGRTRGLGESFVAGFVLASLLYSILRGMGASGWVSTLSFVALAAWSMRSGNWRPVLMQRLDPLSVLAWSATLGVLGYGEWLMDGPQLTQAHPTRFPWIDTPLWLDFAYGLERTVPARELLFKGGRINDTYGCGFLPLWIRQTTGLPMHAAYASAVVLTGALIGALLRTLAQLLFRPDRAARLLLLRLAPLLGALWFQHWVHSFPSLLGLALLLYAWIELARARHWQSLALLFPTALLLMLVHEPSYLAFVIGALLFTGWRIQRDWKPLVFALITLVATRLLYRPLVHPAQGVEWTLVRERLNLDVFWHTLAIEQVLPPYGFAAIDVVFAALVAISIALCWRRPTVAYVMLWSLGILLAMVSVTFALHPRFTPPVSPDEDHWVLVGLYGYHHLGGQLAVALLLCAGAIALARRTRKPTLLTALLIVVLVRYADAHYNRIAQPDPEKPIADDPIVQLLERIDPAHSVIAAPLAVHEEKPAWAAYFGHQFYCLRRGRWTPAYARYRKVLAKQEAIYGARDLAEVRAIVEREGITHVIVDKQRPTAWAAQLRPEVENAQHAVYAFRAR